MQERLVTMDGPSKRSLGCSKRDIALGEGVIGHRSSVLTSCMALETPVGLPPDCC